MSGANRVLFRAAVFVIVRDEEDKVLLLKRAGSGFMDGYYDFPSGHVDEGEGFVDAAVRELAEEAGLMVRAEDLKLVHANVNVTDYPYINIVFEATHWEGEPKIMEPQKCDDIAFFSTNDLPTQCALSVRYVEQAGFNTTPTTSYVDPATFKTLIGKDFEEVIDQS